MTDLYSDMKKGEALIRADERQKVLAEIEELIDTRSFNQIIGSKRYEIIDAAELRAKLAEMKGGK